MSDIAFCLQCTSQCFCSLQLHLYNRLLLSQFLYISRSAHICNRCWQDSSKLRCWHSHILLVILYLNTLNCGLLRIETVFPLYASADWDIERLRPPIFINWTCWAWFQAISCSYGCVCIASVLALTCFNKLCIVSSLVYRTSDSIADCLCVQL